MSERIRLGDTVNILTGNPFKSSGYTDGPDGVRLLRGDNVSQGCIRWDNAKYWPSDQARPYHKYQLRVGDIILAMDRPWIEAGLKYAELRPSDVPSLLVQRTACLRARGSLNQRFLSYLIGGPRFTKYIIGVQTGTAVPHISAKQISDFTFELPDPGTQMAIGQLLGALDDKITVNDRICFALEELMKSRFQELQIDVDEESASTIAASELVEFNPRTPTILSGNAVYLEMSVIPTDSARVRAWSRREPKSGTRFINDDTVMARITPCLENGKVAFVDFMDEGEVGVGSTEFIIMRARRGVPVHLPYFLARSPRFRGHAIRNMTGSSGRQRVGAAHLAAFPIRRPDQDKLAGFGTEASIAFCHMKALGAESKTLTELRDTLLPRVMSGEIRVREAERLVEDVT